MIVRGPRTERLRGRPAFFYPQNTNLGATISKQADRGLWPREITGLNPNVECWDPPLVHRSAAGFTFKSKTPASFSKFKSFCRLVESHCTDLDPLLLMLSLIFQPSKGTTSGIKGTAMSAGYLSCLLPTWLTYIWATQLQQKGEFIVVPSTGILYHVCVEPVHTTTAVMSSHYKLE